jgi:hypothetical protein
MIWTVISSLIGQSVINRFCAPAWTKPHHPFSRSCFAAARVASGKRHEPGPVQLQSTNFLGGNNAIILSWWYFASIPRSQRAFSPCHGQPDRCDGSDHHADKPAALIFPDVNAK